jgi:hypothetical protein
MSVPQEEKPRNSKPAPEHARVQAPVGPFDIKRASLATLLTCVRL